MQVQVVTEHRPRVRRVGAVPETGGRPRPVGGDTSEPGEDVPGEAGDEQQVEADVPAEELPHSLPLEPQEAGDGGMSDATSFGANFRRCAVES